MNKHCHKAKYDEETGKLLDECAECGKNFRDTDVHFTSEEFSQWLNRKSGAVQP